MAGRRARFDLILDIRTAATRVIVVLIAVIEQRLEYQWLAEIGRLWLHLDQI